MRKIGSWVVAGVLLAGSGAVLLAGCTPAQVVQGNGPRGTQLPTASEIAVGVPPGPRTLVYPLTATIRGRPGKPAGDSYRWLENTGSEMTRRWIEEESRLTRPRLQAIPQRAWVQQRLIQLDRLEQFGLPIKAGGRYFYPHDAGTQRQWWVSAGPADSDRVLLDAARVVPSPDGEIAAYTVREGDWETWRFRKVSGGGDLPDALRFTRQAGLSWARDGSGVYYDRYPLSADGKGDPTASPSIYFHPLGHQLGRQLGHPLGEAPASERLIYAADRSALPTGQISDDGRYLVIALSDGDGHNGVSVLDLTDPRAKARPLFEMRDVSYRFIGSNADELYFITSRDAPLKRIIAVAAGESPPAKWRVVVPENDVPLVDAHYVGGRFVAHYVRGAHTVVREYERDGQPAADIPLPGLGTVAGFAGEGDDRESFFSYTDYLTPLQIYRYDVSANTVSIWRKSRAPVSADAYVTEEVSYLGADGTRLPMLIAHRRDMPRDGDQAMLLNTSNATDTPRFDPAVIVWLELGGAYAQVRQNGTDDLIAAAGFLISSRYTRPQRLGLLGVDAGGDAGGQLAGTALTQRPDLFGVVLPVAGALDGIKKGTCYPQTLVTTPADDSEPWRSYQFAAALQDAQGCPNPILIRVGSGGTGDQWAFAAQALRLPAPQ